MFRIFKKEKKRKKEKERKNQKKTEKWKIHKKKPHEKGKNLATAALTGWPSIAPRGRSGDRSR
jgi:hypothetical protein